MARMTAAPKSWADGIRVVHDQDADEGLVRRLLVLPAFAGKGLQAKAAAVCALEDAGSYSNRYRDDAFTLWVTVVRDAAGAAYRPLGEAWKK